MEETLRGHATQHGRVFQQGHGQQLNVERAYFGTEGLTLPWLPDPSSAPLVREWDPLELGVHRAPVYQGNAVPTYVARDVDEALASQLKAAANRGGFVLIVGDSTAGKSRAAYEIALKTIPTYRLFAPDDRTELRAALPNLITTPEPCAVWLDDLERYLGPDGLTPGIVSQLRSAKVVIIATMRTEQYRRLLRLQESTETNERQHRELVAAEHVLKQVDPVILQRRWSPTEMDRARESSDTRLTDAIQHGDVFGIAEYLAAGPKLFNEWRLAWEVGANPRGAAIVAAAIDCSRMGLTDFIPLELIRDTHERYLEKAGGVLLRPEPFEVAMTWAERRRYGVTSLLLPAKQVGGYRVFDYLPDALIRSADVEPVPDFAWSAATAHFRHDALRTHQVAFAAASQDRLDLAEELWRNLADTGDSFAALNLGFLFRQLERSQQAIEWFQVAAEAGETSAATQLGIALEKAGDLDAAEPWLETASSAGDGHAMFHLATVLRRQGRLDEAEKWLRKATEGKSKSSASSGLGLLLTETGRLEEAESWLRKGTSEGNSSASLQLGILLAESNREDEAEALWLSLAEDASVLPEIRDQATLNLAQLLSKLGRSDEAEQWYRSAVEREAEDAAVSLGLFLLEGGRQAEGEAVLKEAAMSGNDEAAYYLGAALIDRGKRGAAEKWLRQGAEAKIEGAAGYLADTLEKLGRPDEALHFWRVASDDGASDATYQLSLRMKDRGETEEAEALLELAAEKGDAYALCDLGASRAMQGEWQEAEELLLKSRHAGHSHAACMLGRIYMYHGTLDKAEECLKAAYDGGHEHAAEGLAQLFAGMHRGKEAALWLRRSRGLKPVGRSDKGASRKKKKKGRRR